MHLSSYSEDSDFQASHTSSATRNYYISNTQSATKNHMPPSNSVPVSARSSSSHTSPPAWSHLSPWVIPQKNDPNKGKTFFPPSCQPRYDGRMTEYCSKYDDRKRICNWWDAVVSENLLGCGEYACNSTGVCKWDEGGHK